jgi:hypothetical protein
MAGFRGSRSAAKINEFPHNLGGKLRRASHLAKHSHDVLIDITNWLEVRMRLYDAIVFLGKVM